MQLIYLVWIPGTLPGSYNIPLGEVYNTYEILLEPNRGSGRAGIDGHQRWL